MILCYITDRKQFSGDPTEQRRRMLAKIHEAAGAGIEYIQLREKDLPIRDLERLAHEAMEIIAAARQQGSRTRLLINSRSDVALSCGADGVHLTSTDISAGETRALWMHSQTRLAPLIGVSCHSVAEVRMAESEGADFALLAPIFGKKGTDTPGIGLPALAEACGRVRPPSHTESAPTSGKFPVLALGGVTFENAADCLAAGAAGIAGIRIFQEHDVADVVGRLRDHVSRP